MQKILKVFCLGFLLFSLTSSQSSASSLAKTDLDPEFTIRSSDQSVSFKRSLLVSRSDLDEIKVEVDPAYPGKKMKYFAVPVYRLFKDIKVPKGAIVRFKCIDGFSAEISRDKILNSSPKASIAYIAIEKEGENWPPLNAEKSPLSAGPFYLIWKNPKLSHIGREEWPFQLAGIEVTQSIETNFPTIVPHSDLPKSSQIHRGFQVFTKNCFTCHTLNLQGNAQVGPDLNYPMNPTEYFSEHALRTLIRDPQKLRAWRNSRMIGFSKEDLSDSDLDDLLQYLSHMSKRKVSHK